MVKEANEFGISTIRCLFKRSRALEQSSKKKKELVEISYLCKRLGGVIKYLTTFLHTASVTDHVIHDIHERHQ